MVSEANVFFTKQLNTKLVARHIKIVSRKNPVDLQKLTGNEDKMFRLYFPSWDNPAFETTIYEQLNSYIVRSLVLRDHGKPSR